MGGVRDLTARAVKQSRSPGRNQRTGRAGEYYVAAELSRFGAYAVTFTGNMPAVDVMATNIEHSRTVHIQVKTKRSRVWQCKTTEGRPCEHIPDETSFWVFVDLEKADDPPRYWIVPDWWIRSDIYHAHSKWLSEHGSNRPRNPESTHHSISEERVAEWRDRWDLLKLWATGSDF